jgi:hypothetical protein
MSTRAKTIESAIAPKVTPRFIFNTPSAYAIN